MTTAMGRIRGTLRTMRCFRAPSSWLVLVVASCTPRASDPADTTAPVETGDSAQGSDPATASTGATGATAATADTAVPSGPPAGSATVHTRADLAPWLGFEVVLENTPAATLACDSDTDPEERHARSVGPGATSLPGLLADHAYTCRLVARYLGEDVELWTGQATTPPLPEGLPELSVTVGTGSDLEGSWLVFNQWDQDPGQRALVVDGQGRIRWHRALDADTAGTNVMWAMGSFVAAGGKTLPPTQIDPDGNELFRGPDLELPREYHHEARMVDVQGVPGILVLTSKVLPASVATYEPEQMGFQAEVHDPVTGAILWTYDVADHLDGWGPPLADDDPWHANAITWEEDGHSWVSSRATDQIRRIDRVSGAVTHVLGEGGDVTLLDAGGSELPDSAWFAGQHAPYQAGDRFFLFDNGRPTRGYSRAVEYRLDLDARTATEVWSWTEEGWFEPYYGSVSLTPSGHVLVASGHCNRCENTGGSDRRAFVAEIDPATDEVLWRMDLLSSRASLFRAQLVEPCDLFHHAGLCP